MTPRRFLSCVAAVLLVQAGVAGTLQVTVLDAAFADPALFRAEGEERLLPYFASRILFTALFVWIFVRGFAARSPAPGPGSRSRLRPPRARHVPVAGGAGSPAEGRRT